MQNKPRKRKPPEVLLLVRRIGIDKTWQVAPYQIKSVAGAERLAEWLKLSLPPFEYNVISSPGDDMTDELPTPANDGVNVPTAERQERIAAATSAIDRVALDDLPIDEDTANLIGLRPGCRRDDPDAVLKAAAATILLHSRGWSCAAIGVALDADGKEINQ